MAYVSAQRPAGFRVQSLLRALVASVRTGIARRAVYVRTLQELEAMDDRELADIGFSRSQIAGIARSAAEMV